MCIFCKIINGDIPSKKIYEDEIESVKKDTLEKIELNMVVKGSVVRLTDFGAFVDIGVHQDGLVHISQVCNRKLRHPSEVLQVGDIVKVAVLDVDEKRKRIGLTIKGVPKE